MNIDDVVVISLPHRADRLNAFFAGLPKTWPFPIPRVVSGVIAAPPVYWNATPGAFGCAMAHVQVIEAAWRKGVSNLLVLEDDAMFVEHFSYHWKKFQAAVPPTWTMLMLGGEHVKPPLNLGPIDRCRGTRRTHAYVIRDRAMPLVARSWRSTRTHIDTELMALQTTMPVFAPRPFLIGQRAGLSDITGVTKPDRFWADALALN